MPSSDAVIPVALAMYHSPRRYALLVGSGISRDTRIFTAGEITDDLIRKIAGKTFKGNQKPQDWYNETKGHSPTFTGLLKEFAHTPDDRTAILRPYFEPIENGKPVKVEPTQAHVSIARLVRDGIISMILTTNFDPLLEEAIRKETGKAPVVITRDSDPRLMEIAGDHCRIVMINGRYPNTDLKLTPEDLAEYVDKDAEIASYLDRIFSEYGLLICGWSGEHDLGLVKILVAERPTRRFSIFWCNRDSPEKIPVEIRSKLAISIIRIESANEFFSDLESRIELLKRHERISPLTVESAVKKVKEALREPRPELTLSDLVHEETERVLTEINRSDIFPEGNIDGKACFKSRIEELERVASPLAAMVATIAYYDDGNYTDLITETIDRLINLPVIGIILTETHISNRRSEINQYVDYFQRLRLYPALLTVYASGIAAVHKGNFTNLSVILEKPRMRPSAYNSIEPVAFFERVNMWYVTETYEQWIVDFSLERFGKRGDAYYYITKVIQGIVNPLIPHEHYYNASFDIFECLFGICYVSQSPIDDLRRSYVLLSRVKVLTAGLDQTRQMRLPSSVLEYFQGISPKISKSTFFGGSPIQFQKTLVKYSENQGITPPETGISVPKGVL